MRQTLIIAALLLAAHAAALAGPMHAEKLYEVPGQVSLIHPRMAELIQWGLEQPDQLTRLSALGEVERYNLTQHADRVAAMLADKSPLIQSTAIGILAALDAKQHASRLVPFIQPRESYAVHEVDAALAADKALTKWRHAEAADAWQKRLMNRATPLALRLSAATGLGAVRSAAADLSKIVLDDAEPISLRLAAADALAQFPPPQAEAMAAAQSLLGPNPLLAAHLLSGAQGQPAQGMLLKLAVDAEPAVQVIALQHLLELDPKLIWPISAETAASADPQVRLLTIQAQKDRREAAGIDLLIAALDDPHPRNRNTARAELQQLAGDSSGGMSPLVRKGAAAHITQATQELTQDPAPHWRAAEQAALLLGALDEESVAPDLVKLFDHPRVEVRMATVAALRELNVAATRQPLVDLLDRITQEITKTNQTMNSMGENSTVEEGTRLVNRKSDLSKVAAEVNQTMGAWNVMEADALLRRFIPKHYADGDARPAAIWALGLLHAGKPDQKLVDALLARMYDLNPLDPEADDVRAASAIAIGRMKAESALERVTNRYRSDESVEIQIASHWAIEHITGKDFPEVVVEPQVRVDAFVSPLDN